MRREGVWSGLSWTAQRLSDGPSTSEVVSWAMGVLIILFFIGCAIASALSSYGATGVALSAVGAAVLGWATLGGPMQLRHRARMRRRLRESGVRTQGLVTDMWIVESSYGLFSVLRYSTRAQDGETRTYSAYDHTSIVWRYRVGGSIPVLYDAEQPQHAIVDDN